MGELALLLSKARVVTKSSVSGSFSQDCVTARPSIYMVMSKVCFTCLCSGPTGVTRRQFLVNVLLDVMVQDTGFTVRLLEAQKRKKKNISIVIFIAVP